MKKVILSMAIAHVLASSMPPSISTFNPIDWRESYPIPSVRSRGTCRRPNVSRKIRRG
jgi:hypothetical protein